MMIGGEGLHPTSKGVQIQFRDGTPVVTDGPFAEAKELIAGFSMIQVQSKEEALEWVKRWPKSDGHGNAALELRQIFEPDDFGAELSPELRKQEERLRQRGLENAAARR